MSGIANHNLSDGSETLLIPLCFRAIEAQRADAFVKDDKAIALVRQMNCDFSRFKYEEYDQLAAILRLREFDRYARGFLARCPEAVVVHIGCGLDTRFERVDNGRVEWFDLDLPEVIELRRKLLGGEGARYHLVACSVFDSEWLGTVSVHCRRPILFLAEAVLPYFEEGRVKSLVLALQERFPGAELVCDAMTPFAVRANNRKFASSKTGARFHWGLKRGKDLESWGDGIGLLDEWFYFDRPEPRLGASQWMRYFPPLGKASGVFHYRLGKTAR